MEEPKVPLNITPYTAKGFNPVTKKINRASRMSASKTARILTVILRPMDAWSRFTILTKGSFTCTLLTAFTFLFL